MRRGVSLFHQKIHDQLALFLIQKLGPDPHLFSGQEVLLFQSGHQSAGRLGKPASHKPSGFRVNEHANSLSSNRPLRSFQILSNSI